MYIISIIVNLMHGKDVSKFSLLNCIMSVLYRADRLVVALGCLNVQYHLKNCGGKAVMVMFDLHCRNVNNFILSIPAGVL